MAVCRECTIAVYWACSCPEDKQKSSSNFRRPSHLGTKATVSLHPRLAALNASSVSCPICKIISSLWSNYTNLENYQHHSVKLVLGRQNRSLVPCLESELWAPNDSEYALTKSFLLGCCSIDDPKAQRAIWNNPAPKLTNRVDVIREWLDICKRQHLNCQKAETGLPARFLELDTHDLSVVRLVDTQDLRKSTEMIHYVALSHCWGSGSLLCKTTKLNLAMHRKGIQIKSLPATFQDAIQVTIGLNIRYLWIDALCIIQDDLNDWNIEAAKMAQVYRGSYVTLAATSAQDSSGGLFIDALTRPSIVVGKNDASAVQEDTAEASNLPTTCLVRLSTGNLLDIWNSSLSQRAWVLQELVLSPRLVHFTSQQMYFQCHEGIESEDGTLKIAEFVSIRSGALAAEGIANGLRDLSTPRRAMETWASWVNQYTSLSLSFRSDRMAAIAGLIHHYQNTTGDRPLLGLWSSSLWYDLGWYIDDLYSPQVFDDSRSADIPKWSWLCIPPARSITQLKTVRALESDRDDYNHLKLVNWSIQWAGIPFISQLQSCQLTVSGLMMPLGIPLPPPRGKNSHRLTFELPEDAFVSVTIFLDFTATEKIGNDLYLLCLFSTQIYEMFLLLQRTNKRGHSEYSRIGAGDFSRPRGRAGCFDGLDWTSIVLI